MCAIKQYCQIILTSTGKSVGTESVTTIVECVGKHGEKVSKDTMQL